MDQKTTGAYSVLSAPFLYGLVQNLFWKQSKREEFIKQYIKPLDGIKILDVGCGTGLLFRALSHFDFKIDYVGFDLNESYIRYAQSRFSHARFFCADVAETKNFLKEKFDVIVILNVLHHLSDAKVVDLFLQCKEILLEKGRLITLDPLRTKNAPLLERIMIASDRGQHIRDQKGYLKLAQKNFESVNQYIEKGFLKVPMTVSILECYLSATSNWQLEG